MANCSGKVAVVLGLICLVHSSFSAAQYRSSLRLTDQNFFNLPYDIIAQALISLLVTLWGVTIVAGDFKEIKLLEEYQKKSYEVVNNRSSFYTFSHRGKCFNWEQEADELE